MAPFLLQYVLLGAAALALARRLVSDPADRALATVVLFWTGVVLVSLGLAAGGRLGDPAWYFRTTLALALVTALVARRLPPAPAAAAPAGPAATRAARLVFGLTLAPVVAASLWLAAVYPPGNWDSLTYHLPRVMYYLGQGDLGHFDTANYRQVFFPFHFNLLQLGALVHSAPTVTLTFLNLAAWLIAGLAVHRLCRLAGASGNAALLATWLALTATQVLAQATSTTNDLPAGAALLCAFASGLGWLQSRRPAQAVLAGLAAALALGTKLTLVFFGPAAVLLVALGLARSGRGALGGVVRSWAPATLAAGALAAPFALLNLAAQGTWMTSAYDYTLNRPFSAAHALQTAHAYLLQLTLEPLHRFSHDPALTARLNEWAARELLPHWREAGAFSPLYVFPPDLNEDHVFFGFAAPLLLLAAGVALVRDPRLRTPPAWLALLGLGWLATYFLLNKWSLYNQRYFVPPLLLLAPCVAALWDRARAGGRPLRAVTGGLLLAVAGTGLWFAGSYLRDNTARPLAPLLAGQPPRPTQPPLPPALAAATRAAPKVNFIGDGANERTFLFMTGRRHQRWTSRRALQPDAYNLLSFWSFTRNHVYGNIAHFCSFTLVPFAGKPTAGVEALGTIGHGVTAFDYFGLPAHAGTVPSSPANRHLLVALFYRTQDPDRFAAARLRVVGLSPADHARLEVGVELDDGSTQSLAHVTADGEYAVGVDRPFRRYTFTVVPADGGAPAGAAELPYGIRENQKPAPLAAVGDRLFAAELVAEGPTGFVAARGLGPVEGPYPQWDLPLVRWARAPAVRLTVPPLDQLGRLHLVLSVRGHVRDDTRLAILHNSVPVTDTWLLDRGTWTDLTVELTPRDGENVIELRDLTAEGRPDWAGYLDRYPDVKAWLVSQGTPLEAGARAHYLSHGRAEGRELPLGPAGLSAPPDNLHFLFRRLRVEGSPAP